MKKEYSYYGNIDTCRFDHCSLQQHHMGTFIVLSLDSILESYVQEHFEAISKIYLKNVISFCQDLDLFW